MDSGFRRNDESCEPSTIDANHKVKPVRRLANAHKSVTGWKQEPAYLREVPRTFRSAHVWCPERAPRGCTPRQHLYSHCAAGHQTPCRSIVTPSSSRLPAMGSCPYFSTKVRSMRSDNSVGTRQRHIDPGVPQPLALGHGEPDFQVGASARRPVLRGRACHNLPHGSW